MDPKISRQSLSGTINQKVYVWNLFLPKDRSLAIKNEGEIKPYFRDPYSGTPCINWMEMELTHEGYYDNCKGHL